MLQSLFFSTADAIISSYMKSLGNYLRRASKALGAIVLLKHPENAALSPEVGLYCFIIYSHKGCLFSEELYKMVSLYKSGSCCLFGLQDMW